MKINRFKPALGLILLLNSISNLSAATNETDLITGWNQAELTSLRQLWLGRLAAPTPNTGNKVANNPRAVELGHRLFFDKRLSANGEISCAHCHQPQRYFTDGQDKARAIGTGTRNAPTVVAAAHGPWFFLDGRADSLWSQALGPWENPIEHGSNRNHIVHVVYNDPKLRQLYQALFGSMPQLQDLERFPLQAGPVPDTGAATAWSNMKKEDQKSVTRVFVNLGKAIAAYERKLMPAPSRFDNYAQAVLKGTPAKPEDRLTEDETAGLRLFIGKATCTFCHSGPLFSDFGFHNIGTLLLSSPKPYDLGRFEGVKQLLKSEFNCRGEYNDTQDKSCDELRFIVAGKHDTIGAFKTPSLRNVTKTAPYMHNGKFKTLKQVIEHYNNPPKQVIGHIDLQNPIELNEKEIMQLESFLKTLNSDILADPALLREPND